MFNPELVDEKYCPSQFILFAIDNGISLNQKEDWDAWWACWCLAIEAARDEEE